MHEEPSTNKVSYGTRELRNDGKGVTGGNELWSWIQLVTLRFWRGNLPTGGHSQGWGVLPLGLRNYRRHAMLHLLRNSAIINRFPWQVGKGCYPVTARHGISWLVMYLDSVQDWPCSLHGHATHPHILALVKRLQGAVIGLEQLLVDFPRNIQLNQVQPCLNISAQEELCRAKLGCVFF